MRKVILGSSRGAARHSGRATRVCSIPVSIPAHYRVADQAGDVVDLLHALHLHSVDLAGGYDGALVAFRVAQMVPDAVRSLALINPAAPGATFRGRRDRFPRNGVRPLREPVRG